MKITFAKQGFAQRSLYKNEMWLATGLVDSSVSLSIEDTMETTAEQTGSPWVTNESCQIK
jgi:hypothetical protein